MKKIITKPHFFFFGLIPVFILLAFLSGDNTIALNIHATYFVVESYLLYLFSAVISAMIGINYFSLVWSEKPPKKWLTIIHLTFQIIALLLLFTSNKWNWIGHNYPSEALIINDNSNIVLTLSFLTFVLSAFFHIINFFTSLFLKSE